MSDDSPEGSGDGPAEAVGGVAEQVATGLEKAEGSIPEEDEDAHTAIETAGDVAGAVSNAARGVEAAEDLGGALAEGDEAAAAGATGNLLGGAAGTTGSVLDGVAGLVPEAARGGLNTAATVARGIAGAARATEQIVSTAQEVARALLGQRVAYELDVEGASGEWTVTDLSMTEVLNEPYELVLGVKNEDRDVDPRALLGANVELLIERGEHNRRITGLVRRVVESDQRSHHVTTTLHVVPALWALGQARDSVIFQQKTAVEILETVLRRSLSPYGREVDVSGLGGEYAQREYCVQYRESPLAFCHRLMEEEGIGYAFDCDEGWEKLVLFDRNSGVVPVATVDEEAVPFRSRSGIVVAQNEPITRLMPARQMTATYQTVRDYDWTRAQTRVDATVEGEDDRGRTRPVYDHGHGRNVSLYDYQPGGRYEANDVETQAARRRELLVRDADLSAGVSLVIGMAVGRRLEVTGHPTPGMDGEYLVTRVVHASAAPPGAEEQGGERYHNTFECVPIAAEWRPARRTLKPAIYGVQTAVVTGGNAGEIHTDEYGRVQALFHWDREGAEPTSCWLRVAQVWAGHDGMGYPGFVFIPRVGMEVIVTFLDGDPDRPLVTGAVYNGQNLPPEALPAEASRSMIRTRSLGGTGYNELSFEDAGGAEEVHLRAERNLRELVQHNHDTNVQHNQSLHVGGEQRTTVHQSQWTHVEGDLREVHADHEERYLVDENRTLTVGGMHEVTVHGAQVVEVDQEEQYTVHGARELTVEHGFTERFTGGHAHNVISGGYASGVQGGFYRGISGGERRTIHDGGRTVSVTGDDSLTATGAVSMTANSITIQSETQINQIAPTGIHNITPTAERNVVVQSFTQAQQAAEDIGGKISTYTLALSIYGAKFDIAGFKAEVTGAKIDESQFKVSKTLVSLANGVVDIGRGIFMRN